MSKRDWQGRLAKRYGGLAVKQCQGDDFVLIQCDRGFLLVTFVMTLSRFITFHIDRLNFDSILKSESFPRFRPMGIASTEAELYADIDYNRKMLACPA